jgi:hypothetical protein
MKTASFGALILLVASLASAQVDQATKTKVTGAALGVATGAASTSTVQAAPALTFESSKDDKLVRGQVGLQYRRLTLTVGAKANVSKDTDPNTTTLLADLNGLRNKTTGEWTVYVSHWLGDAGDPAVALDGPCREYAETTGKTEGKDFRCRLGWFEKDTSAAGKRAYNEILDAIAPPTIVFFGTSGSMSPETFKFVDKTALKDTQENHTSWSVAGVIGVALRTNTVLVGSYRREVAYKGKDQVQVCTAAGQAGPSTTCVQKVLGSPGNPDKKNVGSFETKQFFGSNFAVAPKINYDFTNHVTGVQVPIYVLQDKSAGGLTGGIALGWRSDTKEFTASAFVGPVLRLITKS